MNKRWILVLGTFIFISFSSSLNACDVCGCAVSGHQFGILPQFQKHFAGIRYGYRSFKSVHPPLFSTDTEKISREYFHTTDLWGRYVLGSRIQLFGFVPYHHITKTENGTSIIQKGMGDVTLIGLYAIINQLKSENGLWTHHLQAGGGIKLPTGASDYITIENEWIPGIQQGTGTADFMFNANYFLRYNNVGLSTETSWRINSRNTKHDFQYGRRTTSSIRAFYVIHMGEKSLMPSIGTTLEHSALDYHEGADVALSGGYGLYGHVGMDFFSSGFTAGISIQPVISQNIANGNLISGSRVNAQFAVLF